MSVAEDVVVVVDAVVSVKMTTVLQHQATRKARMQKSPKQELPARRMVRNPRKTNHLHQLKTVMTLVGTRVKTRVVAATVLDEPAMAVAAPKANEIRRVNGANDHQDKKGQTGHRVRPAVKKPINRQANQLRSSSFQR